MPPATSSAEAHPLCFGSAPRSPWSCRGRCQAPEAVGWRPQACRPVLVWGLVGGGQRLPRRPSRRVLEGEYPRRLPRCGLGGEAQLGLGSGGVRAACGGGGLGGHAVEATSLHTDSEHVPKLACQHGTERALRGCGAWKAGHLHGQLSGTDARWASCPTAPGRWNPLPRMPQSE